MICLLLISSNIYAKNNLAFSKSVFEVLRIKFTEAKSGLVTNFSISLESDALFQFYFNLDLNFLSYFSKHLTFEIDSMEVFKNLPRELRQCIEAENMEDLAVELNNLSMVEANVYVIQMLEAGIAVPSEEKYAMNNDVLITESVPFKKDLPTSDIDPMEELFLNESSQQIEDTIRDGQHIEDIIRDEKEEFDTIASDKKEYLNELLNDSGVTKRSNDFKPCDVNDSTTCNMHSHFLEGFIKNCMNSCDEKCIFSKNKKSRPLLQSQRRTLDKDLVFGLSSLNDNNATRYF